ncbi:hypothetical protein [Anaeromyxobacter oryzisoli]|uniref:hypothetical protein n=1 Tax=Anaeromyxobacter oryzisoli TaxID=2925408 RepID=UPI001F5AD773|nr:hypothetical protein [Anaeromyxobacter sp. SG63]
MRTRLLRAFHASLTLLVIAACGSSSSAKSSPFALEARVGVYDDGSGRLGTALVATLRDAGGAGPSSPWTITVRDGSGITVATLQSVTGPGAYMASWYARRRAQPG